MEQFAPIMWAVPSYHLPCPLHTSSSSSWSAVSDRASRGAHSPTPLHFSGGESCNTRQAAGLASVGIHCLKMDAKALATVSRTPATSASLLHFLPCLLFLLPSFPPSPFLSPSPYLPHSLPTALSADPWKPGAEGQVTVRDKNSFSPLCILPQFPFWKINTSAFSSFLTQSSACGSDTCSVAWSVHSISGLPVTT